MQFFIFHLPKYLRTRRFDHHSFSIVRSPQNIGNQNISQISHRFTYMNLFSSDFLHFFPFPFRLSPLQSSSGADSSTAVQATPATPWWQDSWNQDSWPANSGSNFDVHVADDTAPHLSGLPGPAPWNISAAEVRPPSGRNMPRPCATNSVTQSGEGRAQHQNEDPWAHDNSRATTACPQEAHPPEPPTQEDATINGHDKKLSIRLCMRGRIAQAVRQCPLCLCISYILSLPF